MTEVDTEKTVVDASSLSRKMRELVEHDFSRFSDEDYVIDMLPGSELITGERDPNMPEIYVSDFVVKRNPAASIKLIKKLCGLEGDFIKLKRYTNQNRLTKRMSEKTVLVDSKSWKSTLIRIREAIDHSTGHYELGEYEKLLSDFMLPVIPNPHVWGFDDVRLDAWALEIDQNGRTNADKMNEAVRRLTAMEKSAKFKRKLLCRKQFSAERRRSISELFGYLFDRHSRLLVCRIDFHFKLDAKSPSTSEIPFTSRRSTGIGIIPSTEYTPAECSKLFAKFTKGIKDRSDLSKGWLGYAAVLEINRARHYHIHAFMIYNGAVRDNPRFMCDQLGEYWKKVTNGIGYSHDCSLTWRRQYHKAIGVIDYTDDVRLKELFTVAIPYLCKGDEYFRVIAKGSRTFWRSEISADKQRKFASKPGPKRSKETAPILLAVKADH